MAKIRSEFGEQQLVMVNYACGFNQSETGKYFEWIIISNYWMRLSRIWRILQIKEGVFPLTKYNTTLSPGFLGQRFNNLRRAALLTSFWRHWFNNSRYAPLLTSLIQYDEDAFQIWWTVPGYGELCVWFKPIRNGKIFWMNDNYQLLHSAFVEYEEFCRSWRLLSTEAEGG